ncbi:hypothetical protein OG723_44500 (plasmid) [Streptomyces sp. NBC_01278]|uniref:hypothetical protein n=1 Tax=Streptomyces sp. NBC_01278 TaxID=2903809 RepID=UPI002E3408B7|nr:hypothetical protein [Streptomyces sp. NBC_01278]
MEVTTTAAAVFSGVAAGGAWRVAKQSHDTAREAAATAESVGHIERDRLHHEFTPQFEVRLTQQNPGPNSRATLTLTWNGPSTLERLAEVRVTVRDDGLTRTASDLPDVEPSAEQITQTVWGPYRLCPGIDGASSDGRTATHRHLELGEKVVLAMEKTPNPAWIPAEHWAQDQESQRVRLRVEVVHPGYRPWLQVFTVAVERPWDRPPVALMPPGIQIVIPESH